MHIVKQRLRCFPQPANFPGGGAKFTKEDSTHMSPLLLVIIFVVASLLGYKIISAVPSLLHTPLMSGMNALSGVTILGALLATAAALSTGSQILGYLAIILAMVNVAGGFCVTGRMLKMFQHKEDRND